jgi:hypothetical protein
MKQIMLATLAHGFGLVPDVDVCPARTVLSVQQTFGG